MMVNALPNTSTLFAYLKQGTLVITPNNRISNQLIEQYANQHQDASALAKPNCLPYQAFINTLYTFICHQRPFQQHPILLSQLQEHVLWSAIVNADDDDSVDEGLLEAIKKDWKHCRHWQIAIDDPSFCYTPQSQAFQDWQAAFQHQLDKHGFITSNQVIDYVLPLLEKDPYQNVIWAFFNEFTPQQQTLQSKLTNLDCLQHTYDLSTEPLSAECFAAKDDMDELSQMIEWVKKRMACGDKQIAVVVPELQTKHKSLQRLFQQHFTAQDYTVSLGQPLSEHPLISHALSLLSLDGDSITNEAAKLLLQTPYLKGSRKEFIARSECLQKNQLLRESILTTKLWIKSLEKPSPLLAKQLSNLTSYRDKGTPIEWISALKGRLQYFGFPGDYPLNSSCYQFYQRLEGLFDDFLQITTVQPVMTKKDALSTLSHLAKATIFQVKKPNTPILLLGLLEASGCIFDSIWVTGLTDQCLPEKVSLSPFIPIEMQQKLQMPKASPEKELHLASLNLKRLQRSSKQCVFSYSALTGDTPNLPSPLIRHLPIHTSLKPSPSSDISVVERQEDYTVPFTEGKPITGGTALLGDQAKCPFRAFAAHRLRARATPSINAGPDASERGQMIHKVLERLWQEIKSQEALLALSPEKKDDLLTEIINETVTHYTSHRPHSFPELLRAVENKRLKQLVTSLVEWEQSRPAFSVEAVEKQYSLELAGIEFNIRIDRLDKVGDKQWVIDYKTTMPSIKPWSTERPEEPQLLLYALVNQSINTLLFIQLKAGNVTIGGLSESDTALEGIKPIKQDKTWHELQQLWLEQLTNIAHSYKSGHCLPEPSRATHCQLCDFPSLCRLHMV